MRLNFDDAILGQMTEGVILLNRQAQVMSSNSAAAFWLEACRSMAPVLRRLIDEEVAGRLSLPIAIDKLVSAQAAGKIQTKAWLCKNGRRDFAIFIIPPKLNLRSTLPTQSSDQHFVALLGEQIRQQMADFRDAIQALPASATETRVLRQASRLDQLLQEVSNLALLTQRDQVFAAERILLDDVLAGVLRQASEQLSVRYVLNIGPEPQGVLYGETSWLAYALQVLIHSLWQGAPPQSHLSISVRQLGDFIVISGQTGYGVAPRDDDPGRAPPAPAVQRGMAAATAGDAGTRLLLCQRIIELHSGFLKVKWLSGQETTPPNPGQGCESFVLTLLCGLPEHERSRASCSDCRLNLQAQAYAQDIALLLEQVQASAP